MKMSSNYLLFLVSSIEEALQKRKKNVAQHQYIKNKWISFACFFCIFNSEIIIDLQQVAKSGTERSHVSFTQCPYMVTSHVTRGQKQETDIGTIHRPYSHFSFSYFLRVDSFSGARKGLRLSSFFRWDKKKGQRGGRTIQSQSVKKWQTWSRCSLSESSPFLRNGMHPMSHQNPRQNQ